MNITQFKKIFGIRWVQYNKFIDKKTKPNKNKYNVYRCWIIQFRGATVPTLGNPVSWSPKLNFVHIETQFFNVTLTIPPTSADCKIYNNLFLYIFIIFS